MIEIHQCPLCGNELDRLDAPSPGMRARLIGQEIDHVPDDAGTLRASVREQVFSGYQAAGYYLCREVTCRHEGTLMQLERRAHSIKMGHQIKPCDLLGCEIDAEVWAAFRESARRPNGGKGGGGSKGRKKDQKGGLKLVGNEPWDMRAAEDKTTVMLRGNRNHILAIPGVDVTADFFRRIMHAWVMGELE